MTVNLNALTQAQINSMFNIATIGREMGISEEIIQVAFNIANAESSFNPTADNTTSTAYGTFQYLNDTSAAGQTAWQTGFNRLVTAIDAGLVDYTLPVGATAANTRLNEDVQIAVALNEFRSYDVGFPGTILPSAQASVNALVARGFSPDTDILQYAYLRHNTDATAGGQVETVYTRDFTNQNTITLNALAEAVSYMAEFTEMDGHVTNLLVPDFNATPPIVNITYDAMITDFLNNGVRPTAISYDTGADSFTATYVGGVSLNFIFVREGDFRSGTFGNDVIEASDGAEVINGSYGTDIIDGGDGVDTVSYALSFGEQTSTINADQSISVSTSISFGEFDFAPPTRFNVGTDTLTNVENVIYGIQNDIVTINAINQNLFLDGNLGTDTLLISSALSGYTVTSTAPNSGTITLGNFTITYSNFENAPDATPTNPNTPDTGGGGTINGTNGIDNLDGTNGNDIINGQGGNDIINGLGGNDTINGGAGSDYINGGSGIDTVIMNGNYFFTRNIFTGDITATDFSNYGSGILETDTLINIEYVNYNGNTVLLSSLVFDLSDFTFDLNFGAKLEGDPSIYSQDSLDVFDMVLPTHSNLSEVLADTSNVTTEDYNEVFDWGADTNLTIYDAVDMALL